MMIACSGVKTRVETTVAIAFAVSVKPVDVVEYQRHDHDQYEERAGRYPYFTIMLSITSATV